jgi:1-aminocyclopropane-1-carboxylate deaminase
VSARLDLRLPSPLTELSDDRLARAGLRLYLKRDDLIHPDVPGNKWRKLKYNLEAARAEGQDRLLTFGGAYSGHIRATAAAGYYCGFATEGVIRGEEHLPLNPSLARAVSLGMRLSYLDRTTYRAKTSPLVLQALRQRFGSFYLLPEGGTNAHAIRGCAEIAPEIDRRFDLICCPCGTGGTLAGLASSLGQDQRALGFAVLKGAQFLEGQVAGLLGPADRANWSIEHGFHFGGYARSRPALEQFMADFLARHGLALDWVYTAKMMYGIFALAERGAFPAGTTIVALITGAADQPSNEPG